MCLCNENIVNATVVRHKCDGGVYVGLVLGEEESSLVYSLVANRIGVSGFALRDLPPSMVTPHLCELAVISYPNALQFVPPAYQYFDMCLSAARRSNYAIDDIADPHMRDKVMLALANERRAHAHRLYK